MLNSPTVQVGSITRAPPILHRNFLPLQALISEHSVQHLQKQLVEKSPAIVLRRTKLTDTSLIVTWCTESSGIIKTVAKGALRPKSPFTGLLDLFFTSEIVWVPSRRSDLHTLTEARLNDPRLGIRRSYLQTVAAGYFCDSLSKCAETNTPVPELYDLLRRALDFLATDDVTARAIHHFEHQLAVSLGLATKMTTGASPSPQRVFTLLAEHLQKIPSQRKELENRLEIATKY